eukprot:1968609-Rhodomonas_salina.1
MVVCMFCKVSNTSPGEGQEEATQLNRARTAGAEGSGGTWTVAPKEVRWAARVQESSQSVGK